MENCAEISVSSHVMCNQIQLIEMSCSFELMSGTDGEPIFQLLQWLAYVFDLSPNSIDEFGHWWIEMICLIYSCRPITDILLLCGASAFLRICAGKYEFVQYIIKIYGAQFCPMTANKVLSTRLQCRQLDVQNTLHFVVIVSHKYLYGSVCLCGKHEIGQCSVFFDYDEC